MAFVVLWIVAFAVTSNRPESGDSDASIVDYYNSSGHRNRDLRRSSASWSAPLFFVWFLSALRTRRARAEGKAGGLTAAAFGGVARVDGALALSGRALHRASFARPDTSKFQLRPNTFRILNDVGYELLVGGTTVAVGDRGRDGAPEPARRAAAEVARLVSFLVALTDARRVRIIPILIWLGWMLVVSIVLIWKQETPERRGVGGRYVAAGAGALSRSVRSTSRVS